MVFYPRISLHLYIYPPDSQESDGGTKTQGKLLTRPASEHAEILQSGLKFSFGFLVL